MKRKKDLIIYIFIIIIIVLISSYLILQNKNKKETVNSTSDIDTTVDIDNDYESISWDNYQNSDITLTNSMTITSGGIYTLTGTISDGMITIDTKDYVKLILNNVSITNSNGPAIYVKNAKAVLIYLNEGTVNYLEDASTYSSDYTDIGATLYSKDDLIFDGTGTLSVKSNYKDAITSKDDLKIINGTYIINSEDDGIKGKDSVYIVDGKFSITSKGDGIKSTNETNTSKGYILIENGDFNINATLDGIQAETKLLIKNGSYNIITGNGSTNNSKKDTWGNWDSKTNTDSKSAKGLKAGLSIVIEDGNFTLNTSDDSIHSNSYIGIKGGEYQISSGDDGIHADTSIIIDDGLINITESYEGIESAKITINNGTIKVVSSDDGINVAGGSDSSSMNRPGANNYTNNTDNILTINDGNIYVNASGDGIDINGSGYIYGGTIIVDGPTSNGDGALDYDNELIVSGGTLIAAGSSGMTQSISSSSTRYGVLINFNNTYNALTEVAILDKDGNTIISYAPNKSYSSIVFSTDKFVKSETYTIKVDGTTYTNFTISSTSTTVGNSMMNGNSGANHGGGRR